MLRLESVFNTEDSLFIKMTDRIDIINDFANYSISNLETRKDFIQKMSELIKPDCPISLNKLYGIYKSSLPFSEKLFNEVFSNVKNTLVNACFLSGLIILIFIFLSTNNNLIFSILFVVVYICIWIMMLFWNIKFTDLINSSFTGILRDNTFAVLGITGQYSENFDQINSQTKDAVC